MLALLSVSLGILNLLPIPILDGGHLLYCLAEALTGRPVSPTVEAVGQRLGRGHAGGTDGGLPFTMTLPDYWDSPMFRSRFGPTLLFLALMLVMPRAFAFIVEDIELQGLQRLEAATVFTYLPVEVGEDFDVSRTSEVVRALFNSELFSDVEISRRGNVLVVRVVERPAITEISFDGLEVLKDETLEEVLEDAGIAAGRIFNQPLLDRLNNEILQQYHAIGFYNAEVAVDIHDMGENRVAIHINVVEGEPATIPAGTRGRQCLVYRGAATGPVRILRAGLVRHHGQHRQVFEVAAVGRPGAFAFVLPEPRVPEVPGWIRRRFR